MRPVPNREADWGGFAKPVLVFRVSLTPFCAFHIAFSWVACRARSYAPGSRNRMKIVDIYFLV